MIPDWLMPWWNWWAGVTSLVHWGALGALGTVATFAGALYLADAANRDRRRRDAAILLAVAHAFGTAAKILWHGREQIDAGYPTEVAVDAMLKAGGIKAQSDALQAVTVTTLPSARVIDALGGGKGVLLLIDDDMRDSLKKGGYALRTLPEEITKAADSLAAYADQMDAEAHRILRLGGPF